MSDAFAGAGPVRGSLVLREDVLLIPVDELDEATRGSLDCQADDVAVTRPTSRAPSLLVDRRGSRVLRQFRRPRGLVEAVILSGRVSGEDPEELLEPALELVRRMLRRGILVSADGDGAEGADGTEGEGTGVRPLLRPGDRAGAFEVVRPIRVLEDSELHLAAGPSGRWAALKIVRPEGGGLPEVIRREAVALRKLGADTGVAPRLLAELEVRGRPALAIEWIRGAGVESVAARLRGRRPEAEGAASLLGLCRRVAEAYAELHERGVLHGDVHPHNLLVDREGEPWILDFGLSHLVGGTGGDSPGGSGPGPSGGDGTRNGGVGPGPAAPTGEDRVPRGGVAFYHDPEHAGALLAGAPPPDPTPASEQYALGAVLYLLVAGHHYLDFRLGRRKLLRQVRDEGPRSFEDRGVRPWPGLEEALGRALEKSPGGRFATVRALADRLASLEPSAAEAAEGAEGASPAPPTLPAGPAGGAAPELAGAAVPGRGAAPPGLRSTSGLDDVADRVRSALLAGGERAAHHPPPRPPTASVNYGAAGVAVALHRMALAGDDAELLAAADLWASRAEEELREADAADPGPGAATTRGRDGEAAPTAKGVEGPPAGAASEAFYAPEIEITPETVGRASPWHATAGVHAVRARVARSMGDPAGLESAVRAYVESSTAGHAGLDLTLGVAGSLLHAALLLDLAAGAPEVDAAPLRGLGEDLRRDLWERIEAMPPIRRSDVGHLGIAHGWAGFLYALLHWSRASGTRPPDGITERLEQLAGLAEPAGRGLSWPWRMDAPSAGPNHMPGWCNGSAGHVFLWTLAARVLEDDRHLELAEGAAWDAWDAPDRAASLCCGLVGRGYAMLELHRSCGGDGWLRRARDLARLAAADGSFEEEWPRSLYKGELALAVLAADLERPREAAFPFFGDEGW